MPIRYRRAARAGGTKRRPMADGSSGSDPATAASTSPQSSAVRASGPSLSIVLLSAMAPWRLTRPKVGRRPVTPQNAAGYWIDPQVSEPIANGTSPAATAAPDPLDEPPDQRTDPTVSGPGPEKLANAWSVAHAARELDHGQLGAEHGAGVVAAGGPPSRRPGAAAVRYPPAPQVVGAPSTASRSFTPYGIPWSGPRSFPRASSASRSRASASAGFAQHAHHRVVGRAQALQPIEDCAPPARRTRSGAIAEAARDRGWSKEIDRWPRLDRVRRIRLVAVGEIERRRRSSPAWICSATPASSLAVRRLPYSSADDLDQRQHRRAPLLQCGGCRIGRKPRRVETGEVESRCLRRHAQRWGERRQRQRLGEGSAVHVCALRSWR